MRKGSGLILLSAAAFGTMAVLAHHGARSGLDVPTMMLLRFSLCSAILFAARPFAHEPMPEKGLYLRLFGMGAIYFGQSFCFFAALRHIPSALVSLLLYLYPVLVAGASVAFFHERLTRIKIVCLGLALVGTGLTIGRVHSGDALGVILAIGSAVLYSAYLLLGNAVGKAVAPVTLTAFVTGSTAVCYLLYGLAQGFSPVTVEGWSWGVALALASVIALGGLLAGLPEVGPVNASVLSAVEPVTTAILAAWLLGQRLEPMQMLGGLVILVAVIALVRSRDESPEHSR